MEKIVIKCIILMIFISTICSGQKSISYFELNSVTDTNKVDQYDLDNTFVTIKDVVADVYNITPQRIITNNEFVASKLFSYKTSIINGNSLVLQELQKYYLFNISEVKQYRDVMVLRKTKSVVCTITPDDYIGGGVYPEGYVWCGDQICNSCSLRDISIMLEQERNELIEFEDSGEYYDGFKIPYSVLYYSDTELNKWMYNNIGFSFVKETRLINFLMISFN